MRQANHLFFLTLAVTAMVVVPGASGQTLVRHLTAADRAPFDLILRSTDDPDFLSARQATLRRKLLDHGVDPRHPERLSLATIGRSRMADAAGIELFAPARTAEVVEVDWAHRQVVVYRFPEFYSFHSQVDTNLVGIAFRAARAVEDSLVQVQIHDLASWQRESVSIGVADQWKRDIKNRQLATGPDDGLLNFRIPVKIPRSLERVIGKGEATSIRISGQESISISGESSRQSNFVGNEIRQNQSLFPSLEMTQTLRVNLDGTVGEKIKVRVTHDSAQFGDQATEVKLAFEGDEDDIIQLIRAGDIDVTLPGSRLLGVGAKKGGLFGIKVEGALGNLDFTLVTSKEQNREGKATFNQSGGSEQDFRVRNTDYIRERFYRLTAPVPFFYDGELTPGQVLVDGSGSWPDGWHIDINSLEVYLTIFGGESDADTADKAIALVDLSGIGWEPLPSGELEDISDVALVEGRFRRLTSGIEWSQLISSGQLIGIALTSPVADRDALAVAYTILDGDKNPVRGVGRSIDHPNALVPSPITGEPVNIFKLIKPPTRSTPFPTGDSNPDDFDLTWEYMFRNFYDLKGSEIDPRSFQMQIHLTADHGETPHLDTTDFAVPWIRVFGLDRLDASGNPGTDDVVDVDDPLLFNFDLGYVQFPTLRPFAKDPGFPPGSSFDIWTGVTDYLGQDVPDPALSLAEAQKNDIYLKELRNAEDLNRNYTFDLVFSHASTSSRFRLNSFNIKEGSEEVFLDGQLLARGIDYEIDYFSGEINLTGAAHRVNPNSNFRVEFEQGSLFGGGRTSLHGIHLGYELGRNRTLSTTWLLQTQPNSSRKPKLGEEPSRNWVGNLQGRLQFQPQWLRSFVNLLPTVRSTREVNFTTDGEVAISIPNPNTTGRAYIEDFEAVDDSDAIPLSRDGWTWPSLPAVPGVGGARQFGPQDRVYSRWHRQNPGVNRGSLNPELSSQERRDVVPTLVLHMESNDPDLWQPEEYGGIMRGFPGALDLSQTQFLEFWVNDFVPSEALREGTLHFDFGTINEDFWWSQNDSTTYVLGRLDEEDRDDDGRLGIFDGISEDTGLDGVPDGPAEPSSRYPQRAPQGNDTAGDNYDPSPQNSNARFKEFIYINGTENNQRLDSEDLNRDNTFDFGDGYYSLSLDLNDPNSQVDVLRDYPDAPFDVIDPDNLRYAWRKYRLDFRDLQVHRGNDVIEPDNRYRDITPDITRIKHMRIWYENPDGTTRAPAVTLVFTEMRFLGNRWLADGIRDLSQNRVTTVGTEGFRVGVINNKDNPEYVPPVFPDTRNNVAEKEQALQFTYTDLESGHQLRARNQIPGFDGQDFSVYGELNFFWRAPFSDGFPDSSQWNLEPYYWVGSDSLNYYEISFGFDEVQYDQFWQECNVDLAEMTNVKSSPLEPLHPGSPVDVQRGEVIDRVTGERYRVTVRGRPDLRRVRTHYAGVRYPLQVDITGQNIGPPLTGEVLFNEIRLQEVDRAIGLAKRASAQLEMPGFGNLNFEWSETDAEFRGLNQRVGGGVLRRSWNARASSNLKNLLPTFGIDVPFNFSTRRNLDLPKFFPASDIELLDNEARRAERTENRTSNFSLQVRKSEPSENPWVQYTLDAVNYSLNGSNGERFSPSQEQTSSTASSKLDYDLRLPARGFDFPIPLTKKRFRYLPNQVTMGASMDYQENQRTDKFRDRPSVVRPQNFSKGMVLRGSVVLAPLQGINGRWNVTSNRNLIVPLEESIVEGSQVYEDNPATPDPDDTKLVSQEYRRPDTKFLGFVDIGLEETHAEQTSVNLTPDLPVVKWFDPDVQYTASYSEARQPTIRQRDGDDFLGEPRQVRNMSNKGDTTFRGKVNFIGWLKGKWEKRQRSRPASRPSEEDADRSPPPPLPPAPTPHPPEPDETEDDGERDAEDEPDPEDEADPDEPEDAEPPEGEIGPPATLEDLQRDAERQRREAQERAAEERAAAEAAGPDETPAEDSGPQLDPREALLSLVRPFGRVIWNMQPITSSYTHSRTSNYTHVNGRAQWLYRLGLSKNNGVTSPVNPLRPEELFSSSQLNTSHRVSFNTQTELSETIRMDMTYTGDFRTREGSNTPRTRDTVVEFPSATVRIQRVHEWPVFGNLFSNSNIDVTVRRSSTLSGSAQVTDPKIDWSVGPRWGVGFPNGLDANLNGRWQHSRAPAPQSTSFNKQLRVALTVSKKFDAEGRLGFLRFGRKGTGTTIDMDLSISYDRSRRYRRIKDPRDETREIDSQVSGNQTISVDPNFSYQFSRNLRAGLRLKYSQITNLALENAVTRAIGLGLNATLTF